MDKRDWLSQMANISGWGFALAVSYLCGSVEPGCGQRLIQVLVTLVVGDGPSGDDELGADACSANLRAAICVRPTCFLFNDHCAVSAAEPAQRHGGKAGAGQPFGQDLAAVCGTAWADDLHIFCGQFLDPLVVAAIDR